MAAEGIDVVGSDARFRRDPDRGGARLRRRAPPAVRPEPRGAARPPRQAPGGARRRGHAGLPTRHGGHPERRLDGGDGARQLRRPAGGDHRSRRAQDDDQRPELGRAGLHGRPRGRALADVVERRRRPGGDPRCGPPAADIRPGGRQVIPPQRRDRDAVVRPRGWHLDEAHVLVDGEPVSASLFDFGLFLFHNGQELLDRGAGRTSTSPSSRPPRRPASGTRSSSSPRRWWAFPSVPSGRPS